MDEKKLVITKRVKRLLFTLAVLFLLPIIFYLVDDKNIYLIHIFENEWNEHQEICKSIIASALGIYDKKIYAKDCSIKEVNSKEAKQDLISIKQYIKYNLQEPEIAQKLIFKIRKEINNLKDNPKLYTIIDNNIIKELKIRKLIVDNYIIFFRIKNNCIQIVRIMYRKRNWINLL